MVTRRTFITAGVAGSAALAAAYWWRKARHTEGASSGRDAETDEIVAAIVPAMLADALPTPAAERASSVDGTVSAVRQAIAGLAPAAQRELAQLFALLAFPPARVAIARVVPAWRDAGVDDVNAFLERWRTSRLQLLRSGYDALHQLVFAAWYGQPRAWPAIGYPGPPGLGS